MPDFHGIFSRLFEFHTDLVSYDLKIVLLLAVGFTLAGLFGYFALRLKVSPILGYLLVGYLVGPYSPGFVADVEISEQLAEIGVILMMFGVGLNFKVQDLMKVKRIAIPGAIGQTFLSAAICALLVYFFGWPLKTGIILGLAISVASTVVLFRMLGENQLMNTQEGHIAAGWLIVEDIITVIVLLLLPGIAEILNLEVFSLRDFAFSISLVIVKFVILFLILATLSKRVVTFLLSKVVNTRSHELFTVSVLALVFLIATGTTLFFGISIALGAFIAGMVIRRTRVHHKVFLHSLPMKDAFIVIFFMSAGMLFNPVVIIENFPLFISVLGVIILIKPVIAFIITIFLNYSYKTAFVISAALTQIGEFSFILSEQAMKFGLIPNAAYDIVVACALISIALNPLIFKFFYKNHNRFAFFRK